MKQFAIIILISTQSLFSKAPVIAPNSPGVNTSFPKGYFRNPLDIPIQLAANFGELRPNHYHMGFDIRTNQRENLRVYAAAEGYVSRIKIERFGFGQAIYITHPNGYSTLYAHLNDFYEPLRNFIKEKQYTDQQWEQDIELTAEQFPVTKGQFIALSGNTGGSAGPHLHFEIRDNRTGNNLNPWLFDFGLSDAVKPSIFRLYYYDRRQSTYEGRPLPIAIRGSEGKYSTNEVVTLRSPKVSFGIAAGDKITPVSNYYGIYEAEITVDGVSQSAFQVNNISYDDTRYVNASIDYKTKLSGGSFIQHLSRLPGNYSLIYSQDKDGIISFTDTAIHQVEIRVKDVAGNTSILNLRCRWNPAVTDDEMLQANSVKLLPEKENTFKADDLQVSFSNKAFYDTVPFVYKSSASSDRKIVSAVHYLHNYTVPVHDSFTVKIKPVATEPYDKDRVIMQLVSNRKVEAVKGNWENDWMVARFRDLGLVKLMVDDVPPRLIPSGFANGGVVTSKTQISFTVTDNAGEIKSFRAVEDGNWLMFKRKNNAFIHGADERTAPGLHQLVVTVEDAAGNITEKTFTYTKR